MEQGAKMKSIDIIKKSKQTHLNWLSYFEKNPGAQLLPRYKYVGDIEFHTYCVKEYDQVLAELEKQPEPTEFVKNILDFEGCDIEELQNKLTEAISMILEKDKLISYQDASIREFVPMIDSLKETVFQEFAKNRMFEQRLKKLKEEFDIERDGAKVLAAALAKVSKNKKKLQTDIEKMNKNGTKRNS